MFEVTNKGIRITNTSLWLDANRKVPFSFISHAHADHIKKHEKIIATPETISFYEHRCKKVENIPLKYRTPYQLDGATIELFPSGHILGAAQILVIKDNMRLVYSGDINPGKSATAEPMEIREADILIMECTFGLPQYKFPQRWQAIKKLVIFVERCFKQGVVPVVLSYSLGKSQEVMKILGDLNFEMSVHSSIYDIARIYEKHGITFKNWKLYNGEDLRNRVMIMSPFLKDWLKKRYKGNIRKVVVTGWAVNSNAKYRYRADEAIPLSDHADFDGLINYVKKVSPKVVYITHGFNDFAVYLQKEGFETHPLKPVSQLSLF